MYVHSCVLVFVTLDLYIMFPKQVAGLQQFDDDAHFIFFTGSKNVLCHHHSP